MLDHTGIRVTDLERSKRFYSEALAPLDYRIAREIPGAIGFGGPPGPGQNPDPGGDFWIAKAEPHTPRTHIAFAARSRSEVHAFHARALEVGGQDNGAPGLRPHYHAQYYAAFVLDPDGYNIEVVCHLEPDKR